MNAAVKTLLFFWSMKKTFDGLKKIIIFFWHAFPANPCFQCLLCRCGKILGGNNLHENQKWIKKVSHIIQILSQGWMSILHPADKPMRTLFTAFGTSHLLIRCQLFYHDPSQLYVLSCYFACSPSLMLWLSKWYSSILIWSLRLAVWKCTDYYCCFSAGVSEPVFLAFVSVTV